MMEEAEEEEQRVASSREVLAYGATVTLSGARPREDGHEATARRRSCLRPRLRGSMFDARQSRLKMKSEEKEQHECSSDGSSGSPINSP